MPGHEHLFLAGVPFDERSGVIPNRSRRVQDWVYCAGWIKRGPTGIIGTNRACSVRVLSYPEWLQLDSAEVERGKLKGKPREKFTRIEEMLAVLG